jgi:hypothetical protein
MSRAGDAPPFEIMANGRDGEALLRLDFLTTEAMDFSNARHGRRQSRCSIGSTPFTACQGTVVFSSTAKP